MGEREAKKNVDTINRYMQQSLHYLYQARIEFGNLLDKLDNSLNFQTKNGDPHSLDGDIGIIIDKANELSNQANSFGLKVIQLEINSEFETLAVDRRDEFENILKKQILELLNERLRLLDAAIEHPETKEPCLLLVVGSPDGFGRYVLENRKTKKRSLTSRSLADLLPLKIIPDIPRKEGVVERRKNKKKSDTPPPGD